MNRMIEIRLKRIARILEGIDQTKRCSMNIDQIPRRILPNAKVRELKNLLDMIKDTQKLIEELEDMAEQSVYMSELDRYEFERRQLLFPAIVIIEDINM